MKNSINLDGFYKNKLITSYSDFPNILSSISNL